MKKQSIIRYTILSSVTSLALLSPSISFGTMPNHYAPLKDWHISPVTQTQNGIEPYCALASKYGNDVIMTNTRNLYNKGSLAIQFPNVKFHPDEFYRIDMLVGTSGLKRSFAAKAVKENMIVIKIGQDTTFFESLTNGDDIIVQLEKGKLNFPLQGHAKSFFELKYCVAELQQNVPATAKESVITPQQIPTTASPSAPSIPVEQSVYSPKVAPPTLKDRYTQDQERRVEATQKVKPVAINNDVEKYGVADNKETPLKSGYTSSKKRIYDPETPNEDISEDQREASLRATLEKARTKALGMMKPEALPEETIETAQSQEEQVPSPLAEASQGTPISKTEVTVEATNEKVPPVDFSDIEVAPEEVSNEMDASEPEIALPEPALVQPTITHTVDFLTLPPKAKPATPWKVDYVDNTSVAYCSLSSIFDNGVRVLVNRSADGYSTVGIDFGIDLLEGNRSYETTLAIENLYEGIFTAKAENGKLLVIQAGKEDSLHIALGQNETFAVTIPGAKMAFDTELLSTSFGKYEECLSKMGTSLVADETLLSLMPKKIEKPVVTNESIPQLPEPVKAVEEIVSEPELVIPPAAQMKPASAIENEPMPLVAAAQPPAPEQQVVQEIPKPQEDPAVQALKDLVEKNRKQMEKQLQSRYRPMNRSRMAAPKKNQPKAIPEAESYNRVPAPKAGAERIETIPSPLKAQPVSNNPAPSIQPEPQEPVTLINPLEDTTYPVAGILEAADVNADVQELSPNVSYKWINSATGVTGEVILLSQQNGDDNIDYLLSIQDKDSTQCKNGEFAFQIGNTNNYSVSSVTSADSLCVNPLNASSSTYILHNNGRALYKWRFSGETPSSLMVERNQILATIDENVNH